MNENVLSVTGRERIGAQMRQNALQLVFTPEAETDAEPDTEVCWQGGPTQLSQNGYSGGGCFSSSRHFILRRVNPAGQARVRSGQTGFAIDS